MDVTARSAHADPMDHHREPDPVWDRLRWAITCELDAQLWMRADRIRREDIDGISEAIVERLAHAFRIEWAPRWAEQPADDETLSLDAATFHAAHLRPGERFPVFDHDWPTAHISGNDLPADA
jgi:hypothetical protein